MSLDAILFKILILGICHSTSQGNYKEASVKAQALKRIASKIIAGA